MSEAEGIHASAGRLTMGRLTILASLFFLFTHCWAFADSQLVGERNIGAFPAGVQANHFWINSDTGEYWAIARRERRIVVINNGVSAPTTFERLAKGTAVVFDESGTPYFFATDGARDFEVRGSLSVPLKERIVVDLIVRPSHVGSLMTPVYASKRGELHFLHTGTLDSPPSEAPVRYAADAEGRQFALAITEGSKDRIVGTDGQAVATVEASSGLRISRDGARIAFFAQESGEWRFVSGDRRSKPLGVVLAFEISSDATNFIAAVGRDGSLTVETLEETLAKLDSTTNVLAIHDDGRRTAFLQPERKAGRFKMIVDRRPGPTLRSLSGMEFSRSGEKFAYWGLGDDRRGMIWVNDSVTRLLHRVRSIENSGFVGETLFWIARSKTSTIVGHNNEIIANLGADFRFDEADERLGVVLSKQRRNAAPLLNLNDASLPVPAQCRSIVRKSVKISETMVSAACLSSDREIWVFNISI